MRPDMTRSGDSFAVPAGFATSFPPTEAGVWMDAVIETAVFDTPVRVDDACSSKLRYVDDDGLLVRSYSTDMRQALLIVTYFAEHGSRPQIRPTQDGGWRCCLADNVWAGADTAALAICRAAIKGLPLLRNSVSRAQMRQADTDARAIEVATHSPAA